MIRRSVTSLVRTWPSTIFWRAVEKSDIDGPAGRRKGHRAGHLWSKLRQKATWHAAVQDSAPRQHCPTSYPFLVIRSSPPAVRSAARLLPSSGNRELRAPAPTAPGIRHRLTREYRLEQLRALAWPARSE